MAADETVLTPRKTPRQSRSLATVEAVLEAAARILEERGPDGLNTNAVAERAGVGIGSLYQYFPNKHALVAALVRRSTAALHARLATAGPQALAGDFETGIAALVRAAVAHQLARPGLERMLDEMQRRLPPDPLDHGSSAAIHGVVVGFLSRHLGPSASLGLDGVAADAQAIVRALVDAAAARGETDAAAVEARTVGAVLGYLRGVGGRG
jgi:AcrR family transcriptional regulator